MSSLIFSINIPFAWVVMQPCGHTRICTMCAKYLLLCPTCCDLISGSMRSNPKPISTMVGLGNAFNASVQQHADVNDQGRVLLEGGVLWIDWKDEEELEGADERVHLQDETLSYETPSSWLTFEPLKKYVMSVWECFTCTTCLSLSNPMTTDFQCNPTTFWHYPMCWSFPSSNHHSRQVKGGKHSLTPLEYWRQNILSSKLEIASLTPSYQFVIDLVT